MVMCCLYVQDKSERCGFVQWLDEEWPQRAQEVILTLWDMVNKCIEKADRNLVDMMAEQAMKNEAKELKEILEAEKETWVREKEELVRDKEQLNVRCRFSVACVSALQSIVKNKLEDKKRIWIVVVCLIGVVVALLFGVVLEMK